MSNKFHFIGIGGIGMSALARMLLKQKKIISGSDLFINKITEKLIEKGATIYKGHDEKNVEKNSTVVISTAIKEDNPEYLIAKKMKLKIIHRSDLLNDLISDKFSILVTGSHGKTTTSSLLSYVLHHSSLDPSFVVGGILNNFSKNSHLGEGPHFIAEADESDGSMLKTTPTAAIITNIDREHMDYWKTEKNLFSGFSKFIKNVNSKEHFFWCYDDENLRKISKDGYSYGFSNDADLKIFNFIQKEFQICFDIEFEGEIYKNIKTPLIGKYNALNAASVFGMAIKLGVLEKDIKSAFLTFSGIERRMQFVGKSKSVTFFDDYAHHPIEIEKTLKALRFAVEERRIVCVFQAHRYSRIKDQIENYAKAFSAVDELIVTDIYASNEKPIDGISNEILLEKINKEKIAKYVARDELENYLLENLQPHDVLITIGAGDIFDLSKKIIPKYFQKERKLKIALLFGGISDEHEVSINSAKFVHQNLDTSIYDVSLFYIDKKGFWKDLENSFDKLNENFKKFEILPENVLEKLKKQDVCFPCFHGPFGEDGMIQGFLKIFNLKYVGSDYSSSAICMNKAWQKKVVKDFCIKIAEFYEIYKKDWIENKQTILKEIKKKFKKSSLFIKPANLGSSIGVFEVKDSQELIDKIEKAFKYSNQVLVEEKVIGQELEFAVLGTDFIKIAQPGEIVVKNGFYSFDKKYGNEIVTKISANVSQEKILEGFEIVKNIYKLLNCSGLARVDMFLDENQNFIFNEINTIPGLTKTSLFPKMFKNMEIDGKKLVDKLIISAIYRSNRIC